MQFPLPFVLILTIPSGAGPTDPRVVIGDPSGSIGIFDASGDLIGLLTSVGPAGSPGFFVFDPTNNDDYVALEAIAGFPGITFNDSQAGSIGRWTQARSGTAGTTQRFLYRITTPAPGVTGNARIVMTSRSADLTLPPTVEVDALGSVPADFQLNGRSMPRGVLASGFFESTANDVARAAGVNTDMTVTVNVLAGRLYEASMCSAFTVGTAGAAYALTLFDGTNTIGRFDRRLAADTPAGSLIGHWASGSTRFRPAADATLTLTVRNDAGSGGTIQLTAAAALPRQLVITDLGV